MENKLIKDKKPWLVTIDLDGTLLNSSNGIKPHWNFNPKNLEVIKQVIAKGHKVAIVTGRPWRDTEKIYEELGLGTIVGNYNGASIHHPHDKKFSPINVGMNRDLFREILEKTSLKKYVLNFIIEGPTTTFVLDINDEDMLKQFHISKGDNVKPCGFDLKFIENPQSFIFKIDHKAINKNELITELRRKFGEAFSFRFWINDHKDMVNIEVNTRSISKGSVVRYLASYYNIPMYRTIAFGDGENDLEMLQVASLGVAMKNASDLVKSYANDISDFDNNDAGVGYYLENFFIKRNK